MKLNSLQKVIFTCLALALTTISCSKSGSGSSSQPAGGGDPFVGSWNDISGNTLTISTPSSVPGYDHEVKYNAPDLTIDEPCKLTDASTLTCDFFSTTKPDTLVYNANDSTIVFTTEIPTETKRTFYQPGKAPKDPASNFLHTFNNGTANFLTISHGSPYDIKCAFNGSSGENGAVNLTFSTIDANKEEVKGSDYSGANFDAIYDIAAQTLTINLDKNCYIPNGTVFSLSK